MFFEGFEGSFEKGFFFMGLGLLFGIFSSKKKKTSKTGSRDHTYVPLRGSTV